MNRTVKKGLELILIPLFSFVSSCDSGNNRSYSELVRTDDGNRYIVSTYDDGMIKATRDMSISKSVYFHQLIDSTGDGSADAKKESVYYGEDKAYLVNKADSSDKIEFKKIYAEMNRQ